MKKYFKDCKTAEDVKKTFKSLCKKLHPDCGGTEEQFKEMMNEYTEAYNRLKNVHRTAKGETYEKETSQTAEEYADIIINIIHLEGIKIEICGSWVWVTGDTYPHRETLRAAGFNWSKSKRAWYHAGEELTGKRRGRYGLNQIREIFGSEEVETKTREKIAG